MTILRGATALAAAALLALTLAGCGTTAETSTDTDTGSSTDESTDTTDGGFAGVTLPGTGDYSVPDQAPYGSYELPDYQDGLPAGCTWQTYLEDGTVFGDGVTNGQFIFITDVHVRFVTNGCPDWVQFQ
ncbi:MAG: hypothetical protein KF761_00400 [Salinibacterium sp.]|nr:hypothetical protein [Salinibacterium sp.]